MQDALAQFLRVLEQTNTVSDNEGMQTDTSQGSELYLLIKNNKTIE